MGSKLEHVESTYCVRFILFVLHLLIYLSKLFGQSVLNIQGQGGNISVKTHNDELILIKSSGKILANMDNQHNSLFLEFVSEPFQGDSRLQ